jgi:hypothetical protein
MAARLPPRVEDAADIDFPDAPPILFECLPDAPDVLDSGIGDEQVDVAVCRNAFGEIIDALRASRVHLVGPGGTAIRGDGVSDQGRCLLR